MAIRPPRQRTTFDKKGKGTTTYRAPEQEKADEQLDRYIRDNQDKKNEAPGITSILQDMPEKKADFVNRNRRKDGSLNSAALAMLAPYLDERPEYSRGLNRLVQSSPEMAQAYARRFPIANAMQNIIPRFIPGIGPLFTADQGMKANRRKQEILNTPVNRPDGGFKNFVDFFAKGMTPDQAKNTEIISGESIRLAPQDIFNKSQPMTEEQKANVAADLPFRSPQDMGFLDDENIFDPEKAAIDAALTPGNVFNPVAADKQSKVDFINKVEGTNYTVEAAEQTFGQYGRSIDDMFERSKQKQGMIIRDEVDIEEPEENIAGQFNLTNQGDINLSGAPNQTTEGIREQIDINTQDPYTDIFTNEAFMGDETFPAGGVQGKFVENMDDGGYANMSTYQKLKMMADSLGQ